MSSSANEEQFRAVLRPGAITSNLLGLSLATTLHSLIQQEVVTQVRDFFSLSDGKPDQDYLKRVRKTRSEFVDCMAWLADLEAINEHDTAVIEQLHDLRQIAAHEGARVLLDPTFQVSDALLAEGGQVLRKLGSFWGRISVDINPEFDDQVIADDDIRSGSSLMFDHVLAVAQAMTEAGRLIDEELATEE